MVQGVGFTTAPTGHRANSISRPSQRQTHKFSFVRAVKAKSHLTVEADNPDDHTDAQKLNRKRGRCFGSLAPPNAAAQTFASDGATYRNRLQFDYAFDEAEPSGGICVSIFAGFDPLPASANWFLGC